MSIIIRLQRLPWSASAADVREFFRGLTIPEGGVHIVGGRDGDAFIAFSSDEDARLAMRNDGKRLKDAKIKLFLSSRQEMQKVVEKARNEFTSSSSPAVHQSSADDDLARRKRRASRSRSRSGSRERDNRVNYGRTSRSRSPERSRESSSSHSQPQLVQKLPAPVSGYSSFPTGYKSLAAGGSGPLPYDNTVDGSYSLLDRTAPSQFKAAPGILDRNPPGTTFHPNPPDTTLLNQQKQYQSQILLNEVAFAGQPPADYDSRGVPREKSPTGQFPTQPIPYPIVSQPVGRRRALLPEPDEIIAPMMNPIDDPFYRNPSRLPPEIPLLDRHDAPIGRNLPSYASPQIYPPVEPPPFYPGPRDVDPYYRPPVVDAYDPYYDSGANFNRGFDRDTMEYSMPGTAVCMDNAPPGILRYGDVREFFHPMRLDGPDSIKIIVNEAGVKTGTVYCRFNNTTDSEAALRLDRRSNVRIRPCSDEEYDSVSDGCRSSNNITYSNREERRSVTSSDRPSSYKDRNSNYRGGDSQLPWDATNGRYIVEMTNIPYKNDDESVWNLVRHLRPVELRRKMKTQNNIILQSDTAFVEFNNESDAEAALNLNGVKLNGRSINFRKACVAFVEEVETRVYSPHGRRSPQYSREAPPRYDRGTGGQRDRDRDRDSREPRKNSTKDTDIRDEQQQKDVKSRSSVDENVKSRFEKEKVLDEKKERPREKEKETFSMQQQVEKQQMMIKTSAAVSTPISGPVVTATPPAAEKHTCLVMSNLPPNIQMRDIVSFFQGLRIAHSGIRLMKEPRGCAYVEFCSARDCEQAMLKNRQYMGVQVVTLRPCPKSELTEAVQKQHGIGQKQTSPQAQVKTADNPIPPKNSIMQQLQQQPVVSTTSQQNRAQNPIVQKSAVAPQNPAALKTTAVVQPTVKPPAETTGQFPSSNGSGTANLLDDHSQAVPASQSRMPDIDSSVVGDLGLAGCVCFLHNLPSKITLEEICALFQNEQMIDDSVRMHYSSQTGEPTGDCLLAFTTVQDAEKACSKTNGKIMFGRQLKMWIVSQI